MFKDDTNGETHFQALKYCKYCVQMTNHLDGKECMKCDEPFRKSVDEDERAYNTGFRNGQVVTLRHLKEIADLGELEDLRSTVVQYAKAHKIKL